MAPAHHAGLDAVIHGDIGGQHPDDICAYRSQGMVYTITRMVYHCSKTVEGYVKTTKPPCIQDMWGCGEKKQKVCGEDMWIDAVMYIAT